MRKADGKFLNSVVSQVVGTGMGGVVKGDLYGVEIELEGRRVADIAPSGWQPHNDGSLRPNHGQAIEWVFLRPTDYNNSVARVENLFESLRGVGATIVPSNRTSVHVHFNMADKKMYQVINLFILYSILEEMFVEICGEDRHGNLFCLCSRHAEAQVNQVRDIISDDPPYGFERFARYTALNLNSITKFGSVEFRAMQGVDNAEPVLKWLSVLQDLTTYALTKMHNPADLLAKISTDTPIRFVKEVFSEENYRLLTANMTEQAISSSVYDGLRLVQEIVFMMDAVSNEYKPPVEDFWDKMASGPEAAVGAKKKKEERNNNVPF